MTSADLSSHPILSIEEAVVLENRLLAGDPVREWAAIQQAGAGIGAAILADFNALRVFPRAPHVLVLCGLGHNGADALIAAEALLQSRPRGIVHVYFALGIEGLKPLARRAWERLASLENVRVIDPLDFQAHYDIILDGIFGLGSRLPLPENVASLLHQVNQAFPLSFKVAVDLPTGLAEGTPSIIFNAGITYATGSVKSILLDAKHAQSVGRLRYIDIGFWKDLQVAEHYHYKPHRVLSPTVLTPLRMLRDAYADKREYGHALVIAGSANMPGAALMAAKAALKSGVGRVTVATPHSVCAMLAGQAPEAMWLSCPQTAIGGISREAKGIIDAKLSCMDALLIGPGLGHDRDALSLVLHVLENFSKPIVVDADALQPEILDAIKKRPRLSAPVILTPHRGELARLLKISVEEANAHALSEFSGRYGVIVLLKGAHTRIAIAHRVYNVLAGGPVLARGGSGDILAGLMVGLCAQKPDQVHECVGQAVLWHALAADYLSHHRGEVSVTTTELLNTLAPILHEWEDGHL
ncbi:MAG: NAD(P)H-hydrate dehydratase [Verrucomicrobia bacterium 21-51-4]|nr:MAG: NAD(P)H-hydrate dehydratase [Verrucomicrobia bacterium 21-51-4]HQU08328.1 NAD(P)H-hydrate dehydratase [Opitutales bacterium]